MLSEESHLLCLIVNKPSLLIQILVKQGKPDVVTVSFVVNASSHLLTSMFQLIQRKLALLVNVN